MGQPLCLTFKLPSGHLLLVCGSLSPPPPHLPQPTYRPSDFLQYLVHLLNNALNQRAGLSIVSGGDNNQLNVNELSQLTGWNSLVDFPARGGAYLDNVLTNRPDLFGKCVPIKTDSTAVNLPAGSKLKPVRLKIRIVSGIAGNIERRRYTWNLRERPGIVSWEQTMWMML